MYLKRTADEISVEIEWICDNCGNSLATLYFREIYQDSTQYTIYIKGEQEVNTDKIRTLAKILNINYLQARNGLLTGNTHTLKALAPVIKTAAEKLTAINIDYYIIPEFKY